MMSGSDLLLHVIPGEDTDEQKTEDEPDGNAKQPERDIYHVEVRLDLAVCRSPLRDLSLQV